LVIRWLAVILSCEICSESHQLRREKYYGPRRSQNTIALLISGKNFTRGKAFTGQPEEDFENAPFNSTEQARISEQIQQVKVV
jgi:hypothetical protein